MVHTRFRPQQVHPSVFIAPGAVVVGDVTLGEACSVWFHASLRADTDPVTIGAGTNIQEGAIFHADPGFPVVVGSGCTIGHGAIVHGATIGDNSLIGMRAVLLNGSSIGANSIVGAGALATEGKHFPDGSLILGSPAKVVRTLTEEEIERNRRAAEVYVRRAAAFRDSQARPPPPSPIIPEPPTP
jgi:carbonic anhydrase/acetyltransferase-like protein (isoleucine patch superfamily)